MRVVLDTNVIVSALLSPTGVPARIVTAWQQERFELLVSESILSEYERALNYDRVRTRHRLDATEIAVLIDGFRQFAILVAEIEPLHVVQDDPEDDKFLACAVTGRATYIVSGDTHLRDLELYQGVSILTPNAFLEVLSRH